MGQSQSLTKSDIAALRPRARAQKIYGFGRGLHLYIPPNGSKLWRLDVRYEGRPLLLSIGRWPDVGIDEALAAREEIKTTIRNGGDPRGVKAEPAPTPVSEGDTFGHYADALIERMGRAGKAAATISKAKWILGAPGETTKAGEPIEGLAAALRPKAIASIVRRDVLNVLRGIEKRGRFETARRAKVVISQVFRLAIDEEAVQSDPAAAIKKGTLISPEKEKHPAIIDPTAFGGLLRAIDGYDGQNTVRAALQLVALTALRPGEVRFSTWADINWRAGVWTVEKHRTKQRREHRTPLSPQAIAILSRLQPRGARKTDYIFPSVRTRSNPMSENTLGAALKALGFVNHVPHGFRSSFSSIANESGKWSVDAIERQLAHIDSNSVRAAYSRAEFWDERVRMMTWWADHCDALRRKDVRDLVG